jgi:large subunit ribosomal protein L24
MHSKPIKSKKMRKGDKVIAMAGNERGQTGQILKVVGDKAIVQGLNIRKKHIKRSQINPKGGVQEFEAPIHISNLRVCTENDRPIKLKVRIDAEGQRALYYKLDDEEVLYRTLQK